MTRQPGERHRLEQPMIDRPPRRILDGACLGCERSAVSCAATRDIERQPCCWVCKHEDGA